MPLIMISGYPCSGKTHRSKQMLDFFDGKIKSSSDPRISRLTVHHINDQTLGLSRDVYREARSEKDARAAEYSALKRVLGREAIVIADGLNYIKGFRYQLYCEAKAVQTPSCVVCIFEKSKDSVSIGHSRLTSLEVHVGTPIEKCREINEKLITEEKGDGGYAKDIFENLIYRYEEPNGMTRWDSPLFTINYDDEIFLFEGIWEAMIGSEGKFKSVKPNPATVLAPAADTDYLYELDKASQEILNVVLGWQKDHPGEGGAELSIADGIVSLPANPVSLPQLQRIRRQFITLNRQRALPRSRIRISFLEYLTDNLH